MIKYPPKNLNFYIFVLGLSVFIAVGLSPFASSKPDGLDRVAEDLNFADKATTLKSPIPLTEKLANYQVKGVAPGLATPLAGLLGTLTTFSLTWGLGQCLLKKIPSTSSSSEESP